MSRVLMVVLTVCLICTVAMGANQHKKGTIELFYGVSGPLGNYASDNVEKSNSGHAGTGYCLGINICGKKDPGGFSPFHTAMFFMNKENSRAHKVDLMETGEYTNVKVSTKFHKNFSLLTGLRYQTKSYGSRSLFLTAQVGFNFLNAGGIQKNITTGWGAGAETARLHYSYDSSKSFGYALGCGIKMNSLLSLHVRYLSFEAHDVNGRKRDSRVFDGSLPIGEETFKDMPISVLTFSLQIII